MQIKKLAKHYRTLLYYQKYYIVTLLSPGACDVTVVTGGLCSDDTGDGDSGVRSALSCPGVSG